MPEQTEAASEEAAREPKVRRISNKNPRIVPAGDAAPIKEAATSSDTDDTPKPDQKRGNRRRRGKGKPGQKEPEQSTLHSPSEEETMSLAPEEPEPRPEKREKVESSEKARDSRPQAPKPGRRPDPEKVAKNAWKIFLAEVSEEGVALIGDNDARELARRCFRLSEIFMEEEVRRG